MRRTEQLVSSNSHRAIGYFRVSSTSQAGEHNVSLETQRDRFVSHCQSRGLVAVRTFTDVDTGRRDNRKEYQAMLHFLEDKSADFVIVQYLDRFGRNPKEILRRIWALQEVGVEVQATDEDIKEELVLLVRAGLAGAESKKTSARVKANQAKAVARGTTHPGRVPFGFNGIRTIGSDGNARITQFVHNPSEVAVIRRMYDLAVKHNLGAKAIADRLNELGCKTKDGAIFESGTVRRILSSEILKGTLIYGKKPRPGNIVQEIITIDNFYPPILSKGQWDRLEKSMALRRGVHGRTFVSGYLLSGIARCGYCSGSMVGKSERRKGHTYRRYKCHHADVAKVKCEHNNSHSADALDRAVLEKLGEYADKERTLAILSQMAAAPQARNDELDQLRKDIKVCEKEFALHLELLKRERISEEQFALANEPIRKRYESLLRSQREYENSAKDRTRVQVWQRDLAKSLSTFAEDFKGLPLVQQKAKLLEIIKEIRVYRDREVEIHLRDSPP